MAVTHEDILWGNGLRDASWSCRQEMIDMRRQRDTYKTLLLQQSKRKHIQMQQDTNQGALLPQMHLLRQKNERKASKLRDASRE